MAFEIDGDGPVLFVHAHPDDETIATGGTIALLRAAGIPVTVLTCTRGERGEVIPDRIKHLEGDGAALAAYREGEIADAMHILGVTDHRFLGDPGARTPGQAPRTYEDSGMRWGDNGAEAAPDVGRNALVAASISELVSDMITVIDDLEPRVVVSYDSTGGYGHPDHVRAHLVSRAAAEECFVPFFEIVPPGQDVEKPSDQTIREVDVSSVLDRKIAALGAYGSQLTVGEGTITHSGGQVEPIASVERFRELDRDDLGVVSGARVDDLHLSERLLIGVLAALGGLVLGAAGTSVHRMSLTVADVPVWSGATIALLIVFVLLAGLRLRYDTRWPAVLAAVGVLLSIGVLSTEGPGGSVLIAANDPGWLWVYGPIVIALITVAWPLPRALRRDTMDTESATQEEGDQS